MLWIKRMFLLMLIVPVLFISSCGGLKDPESSEAIAASIEIVTETLVDEVLMALQDEKPDLLEPTVMELQIVASQIALYNDGEASIEDVYNTLTTFLDRANTHAELLDEDLANRIISFIGRTEALASIWINPTDIPEDVGLYVNAFGAGLIRGLADWMLEDGEALTSPEV